MNATIIKEEGVQEKLNVKNTAARLGVSRYILWEMVKRKEFPKPTSYGPRSHRWQESDIEAYLAGIEKDLVINDFSDE